jgi:hypothetical protein
MIAATLGATFETTLYGVPTGLLGTIGVRLTDGQTTTVTARSTAAIVESPAGSGVYTATRAAPVTADDYVVVWDTGGLAPTFAGEDLRVNDTGDPAIIAGESFKRTLYGVPTGLVGTIGVRILDGDDVVVTARSIAGIAEYPAGSGVYTATLTAPDTGGQYVVVWDTGGSAPTFASEDITVRAQAAAGSRYAAISDVRDYTAQALDVSDDDLQDILERAERDVDGELIEPVPWGRDETTGLKYDPTSLETWRAAALNRAVCAQTEYRLAMGEDFFVRAQHATERGPDFAVSGQLPYIGPKVFRELAGASLVATAGIGQIQIGGTGVGQTSWIETNAG